MSLRKKWVMYVNKINVLPKHIADLIAAGEVVERPASVIKELIENSIDAGATDITVEIKRGGITYMRVTDNGCGIEREDVKKAFLSHATSKIVTEKDLAAIGTLGFRGEALASIAAVAKVEILTRTRDSDIGTAYKISGSAEVELLDAGCPVGTTVIVRDIFFNTPARMKFLKKDVTEGNSVAGVVDRIALSHPKISIRFIRDDKQQLVTPGNGDLLTTVYSVFGKDFKDSLIPTKYELNGIKIDGLISLPVLSRGNRAMQFFFLNGRFVKSITAQAALEQAYKNAIMVGRFPACVLNIYVPLEAVDVNVHPAKTEVRFENEKMIFDAVYYAVKSALQEKDKPTKLDFAKLEATKQTIFKEEPTPEQLTIPALPKRNSDFWQTELPKEYKKRKMEEGTTKAEPAIQAPVEEQLKTEPVKEEQAEETATEPILEYRIIGEAFKTYILVEFEGKILLIDKHAAHERMLFEKLKEETEVSSQMLLSPLTITLSKKEYSALLNERETLKKQAGI